MSDELPREECCRCSDYTGRAGRGEDSLYTDDGKGPYCEACFVWYAVEIREDGLVDALTRATQAERRRELRALALPADGQLRRRAAGEAAGGE